MTEPTPFRPALAEKPPRPPHVIALADAIRATESIPDLDCMLIAWWEPADDGRYLRWDYVGKVDDALSLAVRMQHVIVTGDGEISPVPSDAT